MKGPSLTVSADGGFVCPHCQRSQRIEEAACPQCCGLLLVDGRYRIGSALGRGGTSIVYEGSDVVSGKRVAVKVVSLDTVVDWKALELFERGTKILQALQHEALPVIEGFVRDEHGRMYQIREIMDGGSLESRIRDGARFNRREVHMVLKSLLELAEYLQRQTPPVLHRDIKPSNVMFRAPSDLSPVLVDFDAAAITHERGTHTTIVVSPGYTAPEQLVGDAGTASDLYSIGMTMLFVMTHTPPGELPRRAGRLEVSSLLSSLEPATAHVLGRLIEPDLAHRYPNARAALQDLRGLKPLPERDSQRPQRAFWNREIRLLGVSLFRIAVGLLLGAIVVLMLLQRWGGRTEVESNNVRGLEGDSWR